MSFFAENKRFSFNITGEVTAQSPISVSRPDDNFASATGTKDKPRLPRAGAKKDATIPFIPGSSFRGGLRRAARDVILRLTGEPFDIATSYMLTQGVDITNTMNSQKSAGNIGLEEPLRALNPLLSLFGAWSLPGHTGVSDLIPTTPGSVFTAGGGVRTNDFIRDPKQIQFLSPEDAEKLQQIILDDSATASEVGELKKEISELKAKMRDSRDKEVKASIQEEINHIDAMIKVKKESKSGATETIQRPLEGYEAIVPGTVMQHRLPLTMVNAMEMALFLESLATYAKNPIIGGHKNHACGFFSATYAIRYWPEDEDFSREVASIHFNETGFFIEGEIADELQSIRKTFRAAVSDGKFNFKAFLFKHAV